MLILWTGADASKVKTVIGPILSRGSVPHVFETDMTKVPSVGKGDVLLSFGAKALLLLQSLKVVPKGRKVTSIREQAIPYQNGTLFVTFDPGLALMDYARLPEIQWDIQLAMRMHETGSTHPETGDYREVESLHELIERVEQKFSRTGSPVDVSCDIETLGLDEYNPEAWIISCSFTIDAGKSDVLYFQKGEYPVEPMPWDDPDTLDYWQALWVQINWLLTSEKVSIRGANFKYDSRWINKKWAIYCTNHRFDTLLVGSLLDENRSNSLKLHVKLFTSMGGYEDDMDKYDMSRLDLVPKDDLVFYNGGDTDGTQRVADIMRRDLLRDGRLTNFYVKLMHPASKAFEKMERNGIVIDRPYMDQLQGELKEEITRLSHEMVKCLPNKLRIKYKDSIADCISEGKAPLKPAMLKEFLFSPNGLNLKPQIFTEKTGQPSTSMDHLMMFKDDPIATNFISHFKEYGSAAKTLSTFVIGFMKHMRSDGRFHPHYMLFRGGYGDDDDDSGTNTGRTSAKDPAVQCQTGDALILTDKGYVPMIQVVETVESGEVVRVLTHTGKWQRVVGSYRNGVKPVFKVTGTHGQSTKATGNHPLLSVHGFTRLDRCMPSYDILALSLSKGASDGSLCGFGGAEVWQPNCGVQIRDAVASYLALPVSLRQSVECPGGEPSFRKHSELRLHEKGEEKDTWAQEQWEGVRDVSQLVQYEDSLRQPQEQGVQELWGERYHLSGELGEVPELLDGFGGLPRGVRTRAPRCEWELYEGELPLDSSIRAKLEQAKLSPDYIQRPDEVRGRVGESYWAWRVSEVEAPKRVEPGSGPHHPEEAIQAGFQVAAISCIDYVGLEETFDLTIEGDHSYIADGFVVHNTISKHSKWAKRLRRAYIAPPGKTILQLDYSQGELRITAVIAEEPKMIEAYKQGKDLHAITAAELNGYTFEDFMLLPEDKRDELRSGGKAGNFGLIYGMGAPGFKEYAFLTYGVYMTLEEAVTKRTAFFDLYDRLPVWHETYRAMAHKDKLVRSPLGRIRHLPLINSKDHSIRAQAERQCINSPVQSCLSDMMQLAMVLIDREYGEEDIEMFLMTHDSLALYVPTEDAELWAKRLKMIMDNLPLEKEFGFKSPLMFPVDAEIARPGPDGALSLANLKKFKM